MKLRNIWFSFFQGMLKSSFVGGYWGVPLRVGLYASKSSPDCGLSAAIPNVGERGFTFWIHFLEYGLFPPQRPLPTTPAGCMVGSGRRGGKDKRNTFARTVARSFGCSPKLSVRRPVQKSSPLFVRQPPDRPFVS